MNKKIIMLILVFINLSFVSSCKIQDNITPKPEDYTEWDGNYFYYANYRCKTDMTEEEEYLSSVIIDDIEYKISSVEHYKFDENRVHMIANIKDESVANENIKYVEHTIYLIYSFETEQVEYVYRPKITDNDEIKLYKILSIGNEYTIFQGFSEIIKLEHNTNKIKKEACKTYEVNYGYIVIEKENKLFTSTCDDFKFKLIEYYDTKQNITFDYFIQNINGRVLLQILESSEELFENDKLWVNSLTYYDFENNKSFELLKFSDRKRISMDNNYKKTEMFIIGEEKCVNYSTNGTLNPNIIQKKYIDNNVLYTVVVNETDVQLKPLYTFPVGYEYSIYKFEDNIVQLYKTTLSKPKNYEYYINITSSKTYFNLDCFEFLDNEEHSYDNKIIVVQNKNYLYYFKVKKLPSLYLPVYAYYLYQYNSITNEENLLAFYRNSAENQCPQFKWYIESYDTYYKYYQMEVLVRNY